MFTRHLTVFIYILPLFVLILDLKCVLSMPKRYRIYRTKGPPSMPPIIQFSPPPRLLDAPPPRAAAQNFHSDYAPPSSIMMNGMSSYSPPGPSFDSPNNFLTDYQPPGMEYGPPKINNEYGPPKINTEYGPPTTLKPVVHKHIYVHIPPPEPEEPIIRQPLTTVAPQKHYRIVFIKAPTEAPVTYPSIPLQPPDEEKTLVYVLVKKPDPPPDLVLPKPATTVPTKPEVYFIRYKTQKEESEGPYPPSVNGNGSSSPPTNDYPPNTLPNSSYGPPPSGSSYQTTAATLGPPLAAYMINSRPLKSSRENSFS